MEETDLLPTHRCLQERLGSLLPFTLPVKIQVLNLSTLFGSVMCQIYLLKELTAYSVRSLIEKDSVTPPTKVKIIPNLNLVSVPFEVFFSNFYSHRRQTSAFVSQISCWRCGLKSIPHNQLILSVLIARFSATPAQITSRMRCAFVCFPKIQIKLKVLLRQNEDQLTSQIKYSAQVPRKHFDTE